MFNLFKRSTANEMVANNNKHSVADQLVAEIRNEFLALASKSCDFDLEDVERVANDDFTVRRFVTHNHLKKQAAFNHLVETMAWRKSFGVNQLRLSEVCPVESGRTAMLIVYNRDRDGRPVYYNRVSGNIPVTKSDNWNQEVIVVSTEIVDRLGGSSGHTLLLDFTELKFYVPSRNELRLFVFNRQISHFYPEIRAQIILYNVPWILKKVMIQLVKMAFGDVAEKVRIVDGDQLFEYIDKSQVPRFMGGDCDDDFLYSTLAGVNKSCDEIGLKYGLTPEDMKSYKQQMLALGEEFRETVKRSRMTRK